jgi:methylsterol monooxygenase
VLVDDLWLYGFHRFIHEQKWWYRHIHKIHHRAFAPVPIEYLYVHPLEWAGGGIGVAAGFALAIWLFDGMPAWSLYAWAVWRVGHELDIHSGVRSGLLRLLPVVAPMENHDLHHARPTKGNYASAFRIWDRVFGTEIPR